MQRSLVIVHAARLPAALQIPHPQGAVARCRYGPQPVGEHGQILNPALIAFAPNPMLVRIDAQFALAGWKLPDVHPAGRRADHELAGVAGRDERHRVDLLAVGERLPRFLQLEVPEMDPAVPAGRDNVIATLAADSALAGYHLLHSVRGDLLTKMGRFTEAREEVQRAITMSQNLREQELLTERLKQIEKASSLRRGGVFSKSV